MPIGDKEVYLRPTTAAHVLQDTQPAFAAFFSAGLQGKHLLVALLIHAQNGQQDARITLGTMADTKVDTIKIHNAIVRL
jgi:hypothetical protein